jgi:hypothetical protein
MVTVQEAAAAKDVEQVFDTIVKSPALGAVSVMLEMVTVDEVPLVTVTT